MANIVPTWPIAVGTLVIGLVTGGTAAHLWHAGTIADLKVQIAQMNAEQAKTVAVQSQAALKDLTDAAKNIKAAASAGQVDVSALGAKLDTIDRRFRNAKPPAPLPVDCKPGTERVQRLTEGAAAVDQAIARSVPGK